MCYLQVALISQISLVGVQVISFQFEMKLPYKSLQCVAFDY